MTEAEVQLLIKVLGMTDSDQDGEALAAIRTANRMLRKYKLSWRDVLTVTRTARKPPANSWAPSNQPFHQSARQAAAWEAYEEAAEQELRRREAKKAARETEAQRAKMWKMWWTTTMAADDLEMIMGLMRQHGINTTEAEATIAAMKRQERTCPPPTE